MQENPYKTNSFRLGDHMVDPIACVLSRGSDTVQIQPKAIELLACLAANHGQTVSKEYLLEHVWCGVFVVEGALRRAVFLLRKHLGKDANGQEYLETVRGHGYRLLQTPLLIASSDEQERQSSIEPKQIVAAYRGLNVFDSEHSDIFFGREEPVVQVTQALKQQNSAGRSFVLMQGASGSGKSSLARAGVLPALVRRCEAEKIHLHSFVYLLSQSSAHPLQYLSQLVYQVVQGQAGTDEEVESLAAMIRSDVDEGVARIVDLIESSGEAESRLLIIFDQFEELFSARILQESERSLLVSLLYALARTGTVWIIATMRSEFYPRFMEFESLRFLKGKFGQVDIQFPGAGEIADIVRRPADLAGFSFETDPSNQRLDMVLIQEATQQANSLPLLQFALRELEMSAGPRKVFRHEDFKRLGNLAGCLSAHAERVFATLDSDVQNSLPEVLELLVIADPRNAGRVLKRTASLSEFDTKKHCQKLVDAFIEARLMTSFLDSHTQTPSVQVAHEAVLLHWQRARKWAQDNYAEMKFRHWLNELAGQWLEDDKASHYLLRDGKHLLAANRLIEKSDALSTTLVDFVAASNSIVQKAGKIRRLVTVSLIALTAASLTLWQIAARNSKEAIDASLTAEATTDFLVANFESANPGSTGGQILSAKEMLEHARVRVLQGGNWEPHIRAAILRVIAESYVKMGAYDNASEVLDNAETLLPEIEEEHPELAAQVLLELGGVSRQKSRFQQASDYLQRAKYLTEDSEDHYLKSLINTVAGLNESDQGNREGALTEYTAAFGHLENLAITDEKVAKLKADLFNNRGQLLLTTKQKDESGALFESGLEILEVHELTETPEFTSIMGNLATLRRLQGRNEEAVELYDRAIQLRKKIHGDEHPKIVLFLSNKVSAELKLARYSAAVDTARDALQMSASLGLPDTGTASILKVKYLTALLRDGRVIPPEALTAAENAMPELTGTYGRENPFIVESNSVITESRVVVNQNE